MQNIKCFRKRKPLYEGIVYDGSNIEQIIQFVGDSWRESDWIANEEDGVYQSIILKQDELASNHYFNLCRDGYTPIDHGDLILRSAEDRGCRAWIVKKKPDDEDKEIGLWTQDDFYKTYEEFICV